jgi:uncharacterized coiled-coil protein SlyX
MPDINLTDLSNVDLTKVERLAKDTAYAAVGFGVLGFQRAQVRRRELAEAMADGNTTLSQLSEQINAGLHAAGETVRPQLGSVSAQLAEVGEALGAQTATARTQLVELLRIVDERVAPARQELDARIDELEVRLPASTRTTFQQLRAAVALPEQTLRSVMGLDDDGETRSA